MEAHEIRQWLEKNRLMKLFESMQALGIKGIVDLLALKEEDVNILKQRLLKIEIIRFVRALNELKNVGSQPSPPKGARTPRPGAPRSGGPRRRVSARTRRTRRTRRRSCTALCRLHCFVPLALRINCRTEGKLPRRRSWSGCASWWTSARSGRRSRC